MASVSVKMIVSSQSEELGQFPAGHELFENAGCLPVAALVEPLDSEQKPDVFQLGCDEFPDEALRNRRPVFESGAEPDALPHLATADLRGSGVLHQIVDRNPARCTQPGRDIPNRPRCSNAGCIVTSARSGSTKSGCVQNVLMKLCRWVFEAAARRFGTSLTKAVGQGRLHPGLCAD